MKKIFSMILVLCVSAALLSGCGQEENKEPETTTVENDAAVQGTWNEDYFDSGYVFNADGTGVYSYYDDGLWEFTFTYEMCDDDSVDIYYDDGDVGGFWIEVVDENTMMITNSAVVDMVFVRK